MHELSSVRHFMLCISYHVLITVATAKEHFNSQTHGLDLFAVGILLTVGFLRLKRRGSEVPPNEWQSADDIQ